MLKQIFLLLFLPMDFMWPSVSLTCLSVSLCFIILLGILYFFYWLYVVLVKYLLFLITEINSIYIFFSYIFYLLILENGCCFFYDINILLHISYYKFITTRRAKFPSKKTHNLKARELMQWIIITRFKHLQKTVLN